MKSHTVNPSLSCNNGGGGESRVIAQVQTKVFVNDGRRATYYEENDSTFCGGHLSEGTWVGEEGGMMVIWMGLMSWIVVQILPRYCVQGVTVDTEL